MDHDHEPPPTTSRLVRPYRWRQERARLGLPPAGTAIDAVHLNPAPRASGLIQTRGSGGPIALVRTNCEAAADPAALPARSVPNVVPRLSAMTWRPRPKALPPWANCATKAVVFASDVVGLVSSERSAERAVVDLILRRGRAYRRRVEFRRLALERDPGTGHWSRRLQALVIVLVPPAHAGCGRTSKRRSARHDNLTKSLCHSGGTSRYQTSSVASGVTLA